MLISDSLTHCRSHMEFIKPQLPILYAQAIVIFTTIINQHEKLFFYRGC